MTKIITIGDTKFLVLKNEKNGVTNVLQISEIKEIHLDNQRVKISLRNDDSYREAYDEASLDLRTLIFDLLEQK